MLLRKFTSVIILAMVLGALAATAQPRRVIIPENPSAVRDSLRHELARVGSASDSIRLLYNIFDLTPRKDKSDIARELYRLGRRTGNLDCQLDMMRQMANIYAKKDSALSLIMAEGLNLPKTSLTDETNLFVRLLYSSNQTARLDSTKLEETINVIMRQYSSGAQSELVDQIETLYTLCGCLARETQGDILEKYVYKLEDLIDDLPKHTGLLRNLVYTRAALAYSRSCHHRKVLEYDRKLLKIIDSLENHYLDQGRVYRNFSNNRYICYRRMLGCYPELTVREIDRIYNDILELAVKNPDIAHDIEQNERVKIYYLMGTGQYEEVIPILKRQIDSPYNAGARASLIEALVTASRYAGDENTELYANSLYSQVLQERLDMKDREKIRELQFVYDLNSLRTENAQLERERQEAHIRINYIIMGLSGIILVALLVLVFVLAGMYRKNKRLAKHSLEVNNDLRKERDSLKETRAELIKARDEAKSAEKQKTDFINNISHEIRTPLNSIMEYSRVIVDCIPPDKKTYLDRFARIIELNSELVLSLVNDVLDISALENNHMTANIKPVSVNQLCMLAVELGANRAPEGVKMIYNPDSQPDFVLNTDGQKVSQVLINLVSNAIKFTEKGSVTLAYSRDEEKGPVTFTDTGTGIPKGAEEMIFERFRQIDPLTQGCGLGLPICRLIARLLKGTVTVDSTYRRGARFVFTIPA